MPGIDASIPLGAKAPDQMQSLSSMIGIANSAQNLKIGAQNMQIGAQTLQQNQQKTQQGSIDLQERQGVQSVLADPKNYTADDGTVDFNKALPAIMKAAPTTGMKYVQGLAEAQKAHTDATQALNNLSSDNRQHIGSVLASLPPGAPSDVVGQTIDALRRQYKGIGPAADLFMSGYQSAAKNGPDAAHNFILQQARSVLPQPTQQDMASGSLSPVPTDKGTALVQTKTGAATPQGGQVGQTFTPPNTVVQTPTGRIGTLNTATNQYTEPQGAAPATPPPNLPPGENADTLKAAQSLRTMANQAASTVPQQQFNANQIIKLADETDLGKGASYVANLKGAIPGLHWTSDNASNYNQIGHYLALQTAQLAQSSGLGGTDAAHGIAAEQAGVREWTPDALKKTTRVNRALSTGADLFNRGVENAIQASGSVIGARNFQNQWSKVADVDALRAYDAYKNRQDDPEGWKATVQEFGGPKSPKFQSTMQKVDAMRALVRGQ